MHFPSAIALMLALDVSDDLQRSTDILDGDDSTVAARRACARTWQSAATGIQSADDNDWDGGRTEEAQIGKPYSECPNGWRPHVSLV